MIKIHSAIKTKRKQFCYTCSCSTEEVVETVMGIKTISTKFYFKAVVDNPVPGIELPLNETGEYYYLPWNAEGIDSLDVMVTKDMCVEREKEIEKIEIIKGKKTVFTETIKEYWLK